MLCIPLSDFKNNETDTRKKENQCNAWSVKKKHLRTQQLNLQWGILKRWLHKDYAK